MTPSSDSIKYRRKLIGIVLIGLALICINALAYSLMKENKIQLLQTNNANQLNEITAYLDEKNIEYVIGEDGKSILVDKKSKDATAIDLAGQGLIGLDAGPGFELFDEEGLGMTDQMFDAQFRRVLQNTLAETITNGVGGIDSIKVSINPGRTAPHNNYKFAPNALVKVITMREFDSSEVKSIQNLVAAAVTGLEAGQVVVIDRGNRTLSNNRSALNHPERQAVISEKSYSETPIHTGVSGPPGVSTNVQDEGIGIESEQTMTTIKEN